MHCISRVEKKRKKLMDCMPQSKKLDLYIVRHYNIHDLQLNVVTYFV